LLWYSWLKTITVFSGFVEVERRSYMCLYLCLWIIGKRIRLPLLSSKILFTCFRSKILRYVVNWRTVHKNRKDYVRIEAVVKCCYAVYLSKLHQFCFAASNIQRSRLEKLCNAFAIPPSRQQKFKLLLNLHKLKFERKQTINVINAVNDVKKRRSQVLYYRELIRWYSVHDRKLFMLWCFAFRGKHLSLNKNFVHPSKHVVLNTYTNFIP
jgi:hypothetical protein